MEAAAIYGLESQGRALCSQRNNDAVDTIQFFLGTLSPKSNGQIHQIDFDDETNKLTKKVYKPNIGEIWQLQCAPNPIGSASSRCNYLGVCYNEIRDPPAEFPEFQKQSTVSLDWHPSEGGIVATVLETGLLVWDLNEGNAKVRQSVLNLPFASKLDNGKWNPHLYGSQFTFIYDSSVTGVDLRTNQEAWTIAKAHNFQLRDADFNPNRQYYFSTCGDDCLAKFWDFRNCKEPLKKLECHSHWVWRVRYNPSHDQLVLTSGSDSTVVLHSLPSISSEPKGKAVFSDSEEDTEKEKPVEIMPNPTDGILVKYEEHEDAVYAVEWSSYDCWVFASLSYDGRCLINRVPKSEKHKILF